MVVQFKIIMLIRKLNNINGARLRIGTLGIDPHGKRVCIYEHERSEFIVVEIADIYKHFEQYRIDYFANKSYDNKHRLPFSIIFKSEQNLQAFPTVQFSQIFEGAQFVIIYFCTFVEILKLKLDQMEITFHVLYKLSSEILELSIINTEIYISMYDGAMFKISLHHIQTKKKGDICKKIGFISESMKKEQIGISESLRLDEDLNEKSKIWQAFNGKLMRNKKVLSNEFEDNFDYQNSYEEYLGKELGEKHPIKYEMSRCRQYIIGSSSGKIFASNSVYTIKGRWCDWAHLCQLSLKPQINQFWTSYQEWMNEEENWGFPMMKKKNQRSKSYQFHKILIAYFCSSQCSLIISWIIIDKSTKKKANLSQREEQGYQLVKYSGVQKTLLRVSYLKSPISQMRWIGLNQLLLIDKDFNLLFLEFDSDILKQ